MVRIRTTSIALQSYTDTSNQNKCSNYQLYNKNKTENSQNLGILFRVLTSHQRTEDVSPWSRGEDPIGTQQPAA